MRSFARLVALLIGSALVLSGCSTISSMLSGGSKDAAPEVQVPSADTAAAEEEAAPAEEVARFTFYDSFANW